jgi:hypothetical protein
MAEASYDKKRPRVMVTTLWLKILKDSHDKHFSRYCLHKKNPVHKIPAVVWKSVYADFLEEVKKECTRKGVEFDLDNSPTERNLQDNLRDYLSSLESGKFENLSRGQRDLHKFQASLWALLCYYPGSRLRNLLERIE